MAVGRPPKYTSADDFEAAGMAYFKKCSETKTYPTVTGLALALGFSERRSLIQYAGKPAFVHTVKRLKALVEESYEQGLRHNNPAGCIFALKNLDWSDQQHTILSNPDGTGLLSGLRLSYDPPGAPKTPVPEAVKPSTTD